MEMESRTKKNSIAFAKRERKRGLAIVLAILMVVSAMDFSGMQYVSAADESKVDIITAFTALPTGTANQQLAVGSSASEINLPASLSVTSEVYNVDEAQSVTGSAISVNPTYNLTGVTWEIDAGQSSSDSFDSSVGNTYYTYVPVLPATDSEGNTVRLADGVSLPKIRVQIEESVQWVFSQSQTIDGIEITVKAEKDVFPEGAVLHAEKVTSAEDKEKIQSAVSEEVQAVDTAKTVKELVSFDITITDADGKELQPDTSKGEVKVAFAKLPMVTEDAAPVQELKVFHMDDSLNEATRLDTTVNQEAGTLETTAEHFSVYTVAQLTEEIRANVEAEIKAVDGTLTYYDTIEEAITAAMGMNGSTVTLLKDVQTETFFTVSSGTFFIDLNGNTWHCTYIYGMALNLEGSADSRVSITFKDSAGNGSFTTDGSYSVYKQGYATAIFEGGSYGGIACYETVGNLLAEGYVYRNNSDGSVVTDTSGKNIYNVTVTPAPVKITAQPEDTVAAPGYTEAPAFTVTAETVPAGSGETITYQWYKDSVAIDSATSASYTVDTGLAEGTYTYYCVVTCDGYTINTLNAAFYVTSITGNYEVTASNGISMSYPTLETAITAAKSKPNSTVKLLADATTADTVEINSGTFTIDLNGKTWTSTASAAALNLENGSHVTLMDSAGGGKLTTSTAQSTIRANGTDVTIMSGIYENEKNNHMSWVLGAYSTGTVTIQGGTIQTSKSIMYLAYFQSVDVVISGGTFSGSVTAFDKCDSVALSGGEYKYITTNNTGTVANLLASGYGFKNKSDSTWVNNLGRDRLIYNDLANDILPKPVTVQPVPAKITAQPQNAANATYGYTSAPTISVSAETTAAAPTGSDISYQWYRVKSGSETSDTALGTTATQTLPTGLDAGTHSFFCKVTCDGYIVNSENATFTVEKATPTISLELMVHDDDPFIYGNEIYFTTTVTGADGEYPDGTVTFMDGNDVLFPDVAYSTSSQHYQENSDEVPAGDHNFTAIYTPSTDGTGKNYVGVTSEAVEQNIDKADQSALSITEVTGKKYGDAPFTLESTGGSGTGALTFSVPDNNGVLSVSSNNATIIGAGTVTVTATKVADDNYNSATTTREITIGKADSTIAFNSSYADTYIYTGTALAVPSVLDLAITGASYTDVTFTWYQNSVSEENQLSAAPSAPGTYVVVSSIADTANTSAASAEKTVTISFYSGAVTVLYNGSPAPATWYTGDVIITATGYSISDSTDGAYTASYLLTGEGTVSKTLYFKQDVTGYITDGKSISVNIDKTAPAFSADTDGITISENNWKGFLNQITFGNFFKENKDVSISATDSGSGVDKYYYYIDTDSTTAKTAEELNSISFTEGSSFSITDENKYIIYAYAVDQAGNKSAYICTDGIVIDKTAPTVTLAAPVGSDLGDVSGAAKVQMNETGIITYVIKTTEQSGMTAQNILDAADKKTVSVIDGQAGTNLDVAFSGLTANTTYYMYAMGTDSAENNGSVVSISFTTTTTKPIFADNPTITGTYGQQVKDMMVSQVASTNGVAGSWSVSSTDKPSVGTLATYDVVFTPDDAVHYATVTVSVTPTITRKNLTATGVTIGEVTGTYTYDKTAKVPTVTVTDSEATITASDYEYSYSNNISAGTATATVTVTAKGNYTGTISRTFTIAKATAPSIDFPTASSITYGQKLSASSLSESITEYGNFAWTDGSTVPTVTNSGYEVTFTPNAGTVANYEAITSNTDTVAITVSKATPAVTVNASVSDNAGSRKAILTATVTGAGDGETPTGTVKFFNSTSGSDEDIAGATAVTITGGKATYTWTGLASQIYKVKAVYSGSINYNTANSTELEVDTNKQNQAALTIGSIGTKIYGDGAFILSAIGGSGGGAVTFESSDPTIISVSGTTVTIHKAGTVILTATKAATDAYNEAITSVSLNVGKKELTVKADDKLNILAGSAMPQLTYSVNGLVGSDTFTKPALTMKDVNANTIGEFAISISGGTLTNADSYTVTYTNGKMTIVRIRVVDAVVSGITDINYNGNAIVQSGLSVKVNKKTLTYGTDYEVTYKNNTNIGTAIVMITGKGIYTGSVEKEFQIKVRKGASYTISNMKYKVTDAKTNGTGTVTLTGSTRSKSGLKGTLKIGDTVTIGGQSFKLTAIGDKAFKGYTKLMKVTIGKNVTTIGKEAFSGCSKVTSVTIGTGLKTISTKAFYNCKKLKTITISSKQLKTVGKDAIKKIYSKTVIKVPSSKVTTYKKLFKSSTGFANGMKLKKK